jgi:hypothetical protein
VLLWFGVDDGVRETESRHVLSSAGPSGGVELFADCERLAYRPRPARTEEFVSKLLANLATQIFPRWNPLTSWMRQLEDFQIAA